MPAFDRKPEKTLYMLFTYKARFGGLFLLDEKDRMV